MSVINWALASEAAVGRGHATLADVINRPLRAVLTASGYDPDQDFLTGFAKTTHTHLTAQVTDLATAATGITSVGTITTGAWTATPIAAAYLGAHTHTFAQITVTPTTLAGYGITDAYTKTAVDTSFTTLNASNLTSGTVPGARFPSVLPAVDGSALTNLASAALTGTIAVARLTGAYTGITGLGAIVGGLTVSSGTTALQAVTAASLALSGAITLGTWQGVVIAPQFGGTGVSNANTLTLAGNLATAGAFNITLTATAATAVTLPTTGVLVNTAVTALTSLVTVGVLASPHMTGAVVDSGGFTVTAGTSALQALTATTGTFSSNVSTQALTATTGTFAGNLVVAYSGASASLALNPTAGSASDSSQLLLQRNGALKWQVGNNVSLGGDVFEIYSTVAAGWAVQINPTTKAVTVANGLTVTAGGLTVSAGTTALQALTATSGTFSANVSVTHSAQPLQLTHTGVAGGNTHIQLVRGATTVGYLGADASDNFTLNRGDGTAAVTVNRTTSAVTIANGLTVTAGGLTVSAGTVTLTSTTCLLTQTSADAYYTANSTTSGNAGYYITIDSVEKFRVDVQRSASNKVRLMVAAAAVTAMELTQAGLATFFNGLTVSAGGLSVTAGNVGIGAAQQVNEGLGIRSTALTGAGQYGIVAQPVFSSGATASGVALYAHTTTAVAAFTMSNAYGVYVDDVTKGAGSTVTTQYGLYVNSQTQGATNYAIYTNAGPVSFGDNVVQRAGTLTLPLGGGSGVVSVGAVDSGGAGFRLLRVPN